jgi:imidazolonepropionase-like amidohydrolase
MPRLRALPAAFSVVILSGCGDTATSQVQASSTFLVHDVRVVDGERVAEHRNVLVRGGLIDRIGGLELTPPPDAEIIDGRDRSLLPGLIDAHVHLSENMDADLRQAASLGVTTVIDMFNAANRLERIKAFRSADGPDLADIRTVGVGASAPGGHPSIMGGPSFPTITRVDEAARFIDARVAEGSDYIKVIYDDLASAGMSLPMLDRETMAAVIAAAHARGKKAVVHAMSQQHAIEALDAGADRLAHLFIGSDVSPDFVRLMVSHSAFVIPTLGVLHGICGQPNGETIVGDQLLLPYVRPDLRPMLSMSLAAGGRVASCAGADEAVRQLARQGVPILVGTDAPVPTQTYGASVHAELALLVGPGLTPIQALAAATLSPAQVLALSDRGRVALGLRADLVLVNGDPTTDILSTRRIDRVWKRGVPVERIKH